METCQAYKSNVISSATTIASTNIRGAEFTTDIYASWQVLYRTKRGKYIVATEGGAAIGWGMSRNITRDEAVTWIATEAQDPVTGYGYTAEQAEIMVDGGDAGKGYRGQ